MKVMLDAPEPAAPRDLVPANFLISSNLAFCRSSVDLRTLTVVVLHTYGETDKPFGSSIAQDHCVFCLHFSDRHTNMQGPP